MDRFGINMEGIDSTDSDSTSSSQISSGVFELSHPLVLELHDLKKVAPTPKNRAADHKIKRKRKKRVIPVPAKGGSSSSSVLSEKGVIAHGDTKNKFYSASEAFQILQEIKQPKPAPTGAVVIQERAEQSPREVPTKSNALTIRDETSAETLDPIVTKKPNNP